MLLQQEHNITVLVIQEIKSLLVVHIKNGVGEKNTKLSNIFLETGFKLRIMEFEILYLLKNRLIIQK